ncbi:MAG: hypothetical protein ASARMPREDX12_009549 [Alectoria sarmentosa]|nr:MAG: hypothetical protein ASARMPREDX12_009549 [Alectoria sarmentosa]
MTPQNFPPLAQDSGIHRIYLCFGLVHTFYAHNEETNQGATDAVTILQPATSENRPGKHPHAQLAAQKRLDETRAKPNLERAFQTKADKSTCAPGRFYISIHLPDNSSNVQSMEPPFCCPETSASKSRKYLSILQPRKNSTKLKRSSRSSMLSKLVSRVYLYSRRDMRQAILDEEIKTLKDNMEKQLTEEWKAAERIKIEAEVKAELMEEEKLAREKYLQYRF